MSTGYESLIPALLRYDLFMAVIVLVAGLSAVAVVWAGGHSVRLTTLATWPVVTRWKLPGLPGLPLIVLIAALVRFPGLFQNLWYDESVSAYFARLDWSQLWPVISHDTQPPLHTLLLWLWAQIGGGSALWLRLPELAFSLLSVLLIYKIAFWEFPRLTAQLAALIVALLPAAVYFGVELRPYAMLAALVLGMLYSVLQDRPRSFAAICTLMMLTHHYGLFYSLLGALAALLYWRRWQWAVRVGMVIAVIAAWLPMVSRQAAAVKNGFWIVNSPGAVVTSFVEMLAKPPSEYKFLLIPAFSALLFLSLYCCWRWPYRLHRYKATWLWAALTFGVPALAVVVSYLFTPVFEARYIFPSAILLAIPIAMAIHRADSMVFGVTALALLLVGIAAQYEHPRTPFAALARTHCANADAYYHLSLESAFILVEAAPAAAHVVTPGAVDQTGVYSPGDALMLGFHVGDLPAGRVCVMAIESPATPQNERFWLRWLTAAYPSYSVGVFADRGFNYTFYEFEVQS